MARALIVGCGCRGRMLGEGLLAEGWAVRGTSRDQGRLAAIEAAGIEAALADPDRVGTVLELVGDVAVVFHLLGSAAGEPEAVAALHGPRLERLMEALVDTPVRGVVYEAVGAVEPSLLGTGAEIVRAAGRTWRIPVEIISDERDKDHAGGEQNHRAWAMDVANLSLELLSPARKPKELKSDGN